MLNLDTHILVRALSGELRPSERTLLTRNRWSVSAIVLSELAKLVQLDRVKLDLADREVIRTLNRVRIWPIDLAVAITSSRLDFKGDPGDDLIAATCIIHNVPLLTRDRAIQSPKTVPLAMQTRGRSRHRMGDQVGPDGDSAPIPLPHWRAVTR